MTEFQDRRAAWGTNPHSRHCCMNIKIKHLQIGQFVSDSKRKRDGYLTYDSRKKKSGSRAAALQTRNISQVQIVAERTAPSRAI
jgi:hypothetical protein